jgi:hypothetical protein
MQQGLTTVVGVLSGSEAAIQQRLSMEAHDSCQHVLLVLHVRSRDERESAACHSITANPLKHDETSQSSFRYRRSAAARNGDKFRD